MQVRNPVEHPENPDSDSKKCEFPCSRKRAPSSQAETMTNADLADRAARLARQHPPRTPERRAAAALHTALITTKTTDAARRALDAFTTPETRRGALDLLDQLAELQQEASTGPNHQLASRTGGAEP